VSETSWVALAGIVATVLTALGSAVINEWGRGRDRKAQTTESAEQHRRSLETTSIAVRQAIHDTARERLRETLAPVMDLAYSLRTDVERALEEARTMHDQAKTLADASRGRLSLEPRGADLVYQLDWLQSRVAIYWQTWENYQKLLDSMPSAAARNVDALEKSRQDVREAIKELQYGARQALDELSHPVADTHPTGPAPPPPS
jgi:phage shock protein A